MPINFSMIDRRYSQEHLGLIPLFLEPNDDRPAAKQFSERYSHGGGWSPMKGWKLGPVGEISYQGDAAIFPIAIASLRLETIRVYPGAWVSITQQDGSFEVSRMD